MLEATVLGRRVEYPSKYTPDILVGVPRRTNRESIGLSSEGSQLPFVGFDVWNAYEVSCLTAKGLPIAGVLKMLIPADSTRLVESKSLKLYLNSLNMERLGTTVLEAKEALLKTVKKDVGLTVGADVEVAFYTPDEVISAVYADGFKLLEASQAAQQTEFTTFTEAPQTLRSSANGGRLKVKSHLLRSNCKITHQPDWGTIWIDIESERLPTESSLLEYIVSLRGENHFHEEICELVYERLRQAFLPSGLAVVCAYTRRGGVDINPCRASRHDLLPQWLGDITVPVRKQGRQ